MANVTKCDIIELGILCKDIIVKKFTETEDNSNILMF